ncbi:plasma-membrane choline transporter-domain-containing protein [Gautieria morchelliformis]|nr:plasma-membrane choline transporter-domain-containing protein [Gautieria morchelliformis]
MASYPNYQAPQAPPPGHQPYGTQPAYYPGPSGPINDVVFLIFFVLQFLGFAALSGIVLHSWIQDGGLGGGVGSGTNGFNTGTRVTLNQHTAFLLLFVTAAGLVFSTVYLILVRTFTKLIMHLTLIMSVLFNIGICVYYWITRYYSGAIIFTIIALFSVLAYFGFRSRIPLASLFLQVTMDIAKHHTSVYVAALSVWFTFTAMAIFSYTRYTPGNPSCSSGTHCSSATVAGLIFFEVFSFLWTSQVVSNVALATLAGGPYGGKYACSSTLSLGSIAFGSLVVTLLESSYADADGHRKWGVIVCPWRLAWHVAPECFIGCIEWLVKYFNRYAYIEIALYGKPYITAAKDTWRLFRDRGIDAIVNDSLVSTTLTWGAYIVGLLSSLLGYLYLRLTHPEYNANGQYTAPVVLFAFIIGLQCSLALSSSLDAGVSTLFVGLGEDPQVLAERAPELFGMIREEYPKVVRDVRT